MLFQAHADELAALLSQRVSSLEIELADSKRATHSALQQAEHALSQVSPAAVHCVARLESTMLSCMCVGGAVQMMPW